ncbi:uncharacterized protein LOC119840467 [Zerene cesonia]|uniref:uncharacterized protein LOC119840467 n=1 Tax=Zerene cesonia TaxID=33412 RepID=UPI0018E55F3F|nr:uncharacterized protein LOC119840467 [Zerene cesonia]
MMLAYNYCVFFMVLSSVHFSITDPCEVFTIKLEEYITDSTTVSLNDTLNIDISSITGACEELFITIASDLPGPDDKNETASIVYRIPKDEPSNVPLIAGIIGGVSIGVIGATAGVLKALTFLKAGTYYLPATNPSDVMQFKDL